VRLAKMTSMIDMTSTTEPMNRFMLGGGWREGVCER